jgi:phosphoenolpyruvate carboxykinase (GTP)
MPRYEDMDWTGLEFSKIQFEAIMNIDTDLWKKEAQLHEELFISLQDKLPKELNFLREQLLAKLSGSKK